MKTQRCIVFLGPSLPRPEARKIIDADFRAPAGQGDIMRACAEQPRAIALIDGIFKDAPTVRHREILWAISQGIPVFGAASMGALRAAELAECGMIGVGLIYRWFRRYPLLPDDAVAVAHGPAELGSLRLSDALVDIRRSLQASRRAGALTHAEARQICARQTALHFPDRKLPDIPHGTVVQQKARDARAVLKRLAELHVHGNWPEIAGPTPPIVHAWLDDLRDSGLGLEDVSDPRRSSEKC